MSGPLPPPLPLDGMAIKKRIFCGFPKGTFKGKNTLVPVLKLFITTLKKFLKQKVMAQNLNCSLTEKSRN